MSVSLKSGSGSDLLTVDGTSKAARATIYDSSGTEMGTSANPHLVQVGTGRGTFVGRYTACCFRAVGEASSPVNLFAIWNPSGSGKNLAIQQLMLTADHTTLLATTLHALTTRPNAIPTGGSSVTVNKLNASFANSIANLFQRASSDGTNGTAITATASGRIWSRFASRPHTLVGEFNCMDIDMLPDNSENDPHIIAPGDGVLLQLIQNATTGAFYTVNCKWEEYTP